MKYVPLAFYTVSVFLGLVVNIVMRFNVQDLVTETLFNNHNLSTYPLEIYTFRSIRVHG